MAAPRTMPDKLNKISGLVNWNGNLMVAIDTETTGLKVGFHEIVEIAALPCTIDFNIHPTHSICNMLLRPENVVDGMELPPTMTKEKLANYQNYGLRQDKAADQFEAWFHSLKLGVDRRLIPLAHNWGFDSQMLRDWLGVARFEHIFHGHYRCTQALYAMLNDAAEYNFDPNIPMQKLQLSFICSQLGINLVNAHTALDDAKACMDVYRHLMRQLKGRS